MTFDKMKKRKLLVTLTLALLVSSPCFAQRQLTVQAKKPGAAIQPTMYGIFFEDINFGADGGLYAELVENRSFEFPQRLMGWQTFGKVQVNDQSPAFERNPHYVSLYGSGHRDKFTGLENHGYFGMGLKKGMNYDFSVWARANGSGEAKIRVELVSQGDDVLARKSVSIQGNEWQHYTAVIESPVTDAKGFMRIYLEGQNGVDLDHVSLFPHDAWCGLLRADLVRDLKDLHPGVFRFPGGCIVEGTDLQSRYQWKNTVGPAENRPLNENRWNYTFPHRLFPNYYQSYGLGFYEFFLLAEEIGAQALPVLSCGLACQFQNPDRQAAQCHVAVDDLQPYVDDALDLIEFANGGIDTKWGGLRAQMGHPESFDLRQIAIGNEQWGPLYPERLEKFVRAIRAKYPKMKIVGSSGPSPDDNDGKQFTYGWEQMKRLGADLVDEHYYRSPQWFMENVSRYDSYDRKGPRVFAGEYACHVDGNPVSPTGKNVFEAALAEAAIMTGFERNADLVHMATYAPLFSHVEGWQWRPDLIWMDNLTTVRTPNYYVQQLYGQNAGTNVLTLTEDKQPVAGQQDGLCATAAYDATTKQYILKVVNTADHAQEIEVTFKGIKSLATGRVTTLHADDPRAENSIGHKDRVVPKTSDLPAGTVSGNVLKTIVGAKTFAVFRF